MTNFYRRIMTHCLIFKRVFFAFGNEIICRKATDLTSEQTGTTHLNERWIL